MTALTLTPGTDRPVPFTLTPKALDALDALGPDPDPDGANAWACAQCADAYFSTPPGDGLCPGCRAQDDAPAAPDGTPR